MPRPSHADDFIIAAMINLSSYHDDNYHRENRDYHRGGDDKILIIIAIKAYKN